MALRVLVPKPIHQRAARDSEQPWPESRPVTDTADSAEDSQPHILRNVPSRVVVTGHSPDVPPNGRVPAFHELVEGRPFAKLATDDQKLVFLVRAMARFAGVGHRCSIPLLPRVADLPGRFIRTSSRCRSVGRFDGRYGEEPSGSMGWRPSPRHKPSAV